jgi:hypothetical protein
MTLNGLQGARYQKRIFRYEIREVGKKSTEVYTLHAFVSFLMATWDGLYASSQNQFTKQLSVSTETFTSIQKVNGSNFGQATVCRDRYTSFLFIYLFVGYLSKLSVGELYSVKWMDDRYVIWKVAVVT